MKPVKTELSSQLDHKRRRIGQKIRASKNRRIRDEIRSIQDTTAQIQAMIRKPGL